MSTYVIKLGGSILSRSKDTRIDFDYLDKLADLLKSFIESGDKFIIVVGGGFLCREYQQLMKDNKSDIKNINLDYIGIAAINLNAEMIKSYLQEYTDDKVIKYSDINATGDITINKGIQICAANEPGHSSDVDSVIMAKRINAKTIFRLTDVDGIYDKDPSEHKDAVKFASLTWDKYFEILGIDNFVPGGHYPIDPIASKMSKDLGITIKLMQGVDLDNLGNALREEHFNGTTVSN